ncbi:hypothetical protein ACFL59_09700 [Planctomycetota bacterium]
MPKKSLSSLVTGGRGRGATALCLVATLALASGVAACSKLNISSSGASSVAAAIQSVPIVEPTPRVEILDPARGSFLHPGLVAVTGRATPPADSSAVITAVQVNGNPATLEPDGSFQAMLTLEWGLNLIEATASASDGKTGAATVGILAGEWKPMDQVISSAAKLRINDSSLDAASKIIEVALWAADLSKVLQKANPIYDSNVLWMKVWINIVQLRFRDVRVTLDTHDDGIHATAIVYDPIVDTTVEADVLAGAVTAPIPVALTANTIELRGRVSAAREPDGRHRLKIEGLSLDFQNFSVTASAAVLQTVEPLIRDAVKGAIEDAIVEAIRDDFVPFANENVDKFLTPQTPFQLGGGHEFKVDVRSERIEFDEDGFLLQAQFDCPVVNYTARGKAAPGSFKTAGDAPSVQTGRGIKVTVDDDALNRTLHGLWAAGILDVLLDQSTVTQLGLDSVLPFDLRAGSLREFLPEMGAAVPDSAPVAIKVECLLPPIAEITGHPNLVTIHAGEVCIEFLVDRGQGFETLLKTAVHCSIGANSELNGAGVAFSMGANPAFRFDVIDEPIVEFDDRRIEIMLSLVLTPAIPQVFNGIRLVPIPHLNQLTVFNVQGLADGPNLEHLTVIADMAR